MADETRIRIAADDAASSVIAAIGDRVGGLGNSFTSLSSIMGVARQAMVGFLGVATVAGLANMVSSVVQAQAALHDLSIESGMSVAALAAFKSVGSYTETSINSIAAASEKMSKSLSTSTEESRGAAQAIRALGLDFDAFKRMSPEQQMLAVAQAMNEFEDGSGKSAAAMMLFGREGAALLPFLTDLAADAERVNGKLTEQEVAARAAAAAMADAYGDNLTRINKESSAWKKELAEGLLPVMYEVSEAFLQSTSKTGGLKDQITQLARDGTLADWARGAVTALSYLIDIGQALLSVFPMIGRAIGAAAAATTEFFSSMSTAFQRLFSGGATGPMDFSGAFDALRSGFLRVQTIGVEAANEIGGTWNQVLIGETFRNSMSSLEGVGVSADRAKKPTLDLAVAQGTAATASESYGRVLQAQDREYANLVSTINAKVSAMESEASGAGRVSEADRTLSGVLEQLRQGKIRVTESTWAEIEALIERMRTAEDEKTLNASLKVLADQLAKGYEAVAAARQRDQDAADAELAKAQEVIDKMGLTKVQLADLTARRLEDRAALVEHRMEVLANAGSIDVEYEALQRLAGTYRETAVRIREGAVAEASREQATQTQRAWEEANRTIESSLTDALLRGFESGASSAQAFVDTLKNMFRTLVLRPIIQGIVQPVATGVTGVLGSLGFPGVASAAGSAGGAGSAMGGLANLGSSISSAWGAAGSLGTQFATSSIGEALGLSVSFGAEAGIAGAASGLTAAGSVVSALGTALPYIGVAMALYSMFSGKGGGPKSGGQSILDLVNGNIGASALQTAAASDGGRMLFTPTTADADVYSLSSNALSAIKVTAAALGGAANGITLGLGYDTDPQGTAQNRLIGMLAAGGRSVYSSGTRELGRDEKALQSGLSDEVSRLILAGLQASTLPQAMADYFGQFTDIANMSGAEAAAAIEAATNAQAMAQALQDAGGAFSQLGTISVQARSSILGLTGGLDAFVQKAQGFVQNYYSQEEQAAIQAASILRTLGAAGVTSDLSAKSDLRALIDSLDLSTSVGQQQFSALLNISGTFAGLADYLDTSGQTLQELATLAPGGATLEALLGSADSAQVTADQATLTAQGVQALLDQNAQAYSQMIDSLASIDRRLATIETTGTLNDAAPVTDTQAGF